MNFDNHLFRSSSNGKLMTDPRSKSETLSETTKTYLTEIFIKKFFGRENDIDNKYLQKGIECEPDSLSLLSEIRGKFIKKNVRFFENGMICGTPDIINEDEIEDVKTCWSLFTFIDADVTKDYDWQLESYCILTGKEDKRLTYTLVNTPAHLIDKEKKFASYKYDTDSPSFTDACKQIEINSIFDMELFLKQNPDYHFHNVLSDWNRDIPKHQRVKSFLIPRKSEDEINKLKNRIIESRKFLNSLSQKFNK